MGKKTCSLLSHLNKLEVPMGPFWEVLQVLFEGCLLSFCLMKIAWMSLLQSLWVQRWGSFGLACDILHRRRQWSFLVCLNSFSLHYRHYWIDWKEGKESSTQKKVLLVGWKLLSILLGREESGWCPPPVWWGGWGRGTLSHQTRFGFQDSSFQSQNHQSLGTFFNNYYKYQCLYP